MLKKFLKVKGKKLFGLFLSLCLVSYFLPINAFLPLVRAEELTEEEQAEINLIPDDNLRAALRERLGKSETEYIIKEDLTGLTSLDASNRYIKDLTGLEHCENLEELNLAYNNISDISTLCGLINLKELQLQFNSISNVSPLRDFITSLDVVFFHDQVIELESFNVGETSVSLPTNIVIGIDGNPINPSTDGYDLESGELISNFSDIYPEGGEYDEENKTITWNDLSDTEEVSYSFSNKVNCGGPYSWNHFTGTVKRRALKPNYTIGNRTYVKLNTEGITWLKEESDGSSAWYGLENPEIEEGKYLFPTNSYFYVEWVSPNDFETNEHYAILDDSVKSQVDSNRGWLFYVGIADETGQKMDINFNGHTANLYVQIGDDWQLNDLKSVFVGDTEDEQVTVTFAEAVEYPEGVDDFGVMSLNHFSPYFIYDNDTTLEGETAQKPSNNHSSSSKNQETLDPDTEENLPIEKEEEGKSSDSFGDDLTNVFVTGDLQTCIIVLSTIGLVLLALILSLVLKSKE